MSHPPPASLPATGHEHMPGAYSPVPQSQVQPPVFRPASGWQHGAGPRPSSAARLEPVPTLAIVLVALVGFLLAIQVLMSASSAGSIEIALGAALLATWAPTGAVLSVLFAVAARHRVLTIAFGAIAVIVAVAFPLLSAGDVWAPIAVTASLVLVAVAAALGAVAPVEGSGALRVIAFATAAASVLLFYGLSIVTPVVALEGSASSITGVLGTTPIALLATAAAGVLCFMPNGRALAGWLVVGLAVALLILPIANFAAGQPPVVGSFVVVLLRAALAAVAGVLLVRSSRA